MRKEGKYMLGTAEMIAEELAVNILEGNEATYGSIKKFMDLDYACIEGRENNTTKI